MADPTIGGFNAEIDALRASLKGLRDDIAKLSGGSGGGNMMPGYTAATSIFNTGQGTSGGYAGLGAGVGKGLLGNLGGGKLAAGLGALSSVTGSLLGAAGNITSMLPGMEKYLVRETGYYQAGLNSMGALSLGGLKAQTMNGIGLGNLTAVGSDATVAAILSGRGVNPNSQLNANLLAGIGQAAKYFNQSNEVAAQSIESLTSGATSSSLLSRGIFTSDPTKKNAPPLKEQQIFEQFWQRWVVDKSITKSEMQDEIRRGFIGANIDSLDIDNAAKERLKIFLIAHSRDDATGAAGVSMDITNAQQMQDIFQNNKGSQMAAQGYSNPMGTAYQIAGNETNFVDKVTGQYSAGFSDAAGAIKDLQDSVIGAKDSFKVFGGEMQKLAAFMSTFMGSDIGAGFMSGGWMVAAPGMLASAASTGVSNMISGLTGDTGNNGGGSNTVGTDPGGSSSAFGDVLPQTALQKGGADYGATGNPRWASGTHNGVDFWVPVGTPVFAAYDGNVKSINTDPNHSFGINIVLNHGGGYTTTYAHLSAVESGLSVGDSVNKGQRIGTSGKTGNVDGPHLHFELQKDGTPQNPNTFTDTIALGLKTKGGGGSSATLSGSDSGISGSYSPVIGSAALAASVLGPAGSGSSASVSSSSGGGNSVTINVTIAQASDAEALRLADLVKSQLQQDSFMSNMGAY